MSHPFFGIDDLMRQVLSFLPVRAHATNARLVNRLWNEVRPFSHVDWRVLLFAEGIAARVHSAQKRCLQRAKAEKGSSFHYRREMTQQTKSNFSNKKALSAKRVNYICLQASEVLRRQSSLLELEGPTTIVGAVRGDVAALVEIFDRCGYPFLGNPYDRFEEEHRLNAQSSSRYLFLGSVVNRGTSSTGTLMLILCYIILCPNRVHLLRGKDETNAIGRIYGFYDECKRNPDGLLTWKTVCHSIFPFLPAAAIVDHQFFAVSSGLPMLTLDPRWTALPDPESALKKLREAIDVNRGDDKGNINDDGIWCELTFGRFEETVTGFDFCGRAVTPDYGPDVVEQFLQTLDLKSVIQGDTILESGVESEPCGLVSVFSSPHYCGEFDNDGAVLLYNPSSGDTDFVIVKLLLQPQTTTGRSSSGGNKRPE